MTTDLAALSAAATQGEWCNYKSSYGKAVSIRASDALTAEGIALIGPQDAAFIVPLVNAYRTGNLVQINREGMRERVQRAICAAIMGPQFSPIGDEFQAEADAAIAAILGGEHDK